MELRSVPGLIDGTWFARAFHTLVANVEKHIRGKSDVVRVATICLIANGHLLVQDPPGTGKTLLAKALVASIGGTTFNRVQCTAEMMPADITGVSIFNPRTQEFDFKEGPVFANLLLCDEINRASPKTQSALLEVMEERRVTVDGKQRAVPSPFVVVATQNPIEHGGTYQLPEAELDRFMMQISIGHPSSAAAVEILRDRNSTAPAEGPQAVMTTDDLARMTRFASGIYVSDEILEYIVRVQQATHTVPQVRLGASFRGSLALKAAAQVRAAADGRDFVSAEDVKQLAASVLAHRLSLEPEATASPTSIITELLNLVRASRAA